jgi:hypothetical protein
LSEESGRLAQESAEGAVEQPLKSQMIDYDAARAKVKKLVEKPSEDPTKLPRVRPTLRCGRGCGC